MSGSGYCREVRVFAAALVCAGLAAQTGPRSEERLSFQSSGRWSPRVHLNADVAMVYGIGPQLPEIIETWRRRGFIIHVMTGVSWGRYEDYLEGKFDGQNHWDQAQTDREGNRIVHPSGPTVPYMSPGENYGRYLTQGIRRALEAGAEAIHLEEPEFWARGGYEESFQREWKAHYGEDWQPPHSSPDAQYRSSKLKYFLYRRTLSQIFDFVREYNRTNGRAIRCYVPSHSLLNYAHWRIVSPESSLLEVGADGYIAQVWTGTARTPNFYEGRRKERTFETAFLEYGAMQNLVRASGRRVWYLNDPVEDNPKYDWDDYRTNWENTLTASLLQPEVWHYQVMPWPERVFTRRYLRRASSGASSERVGIPKPYETELQSVIRALSEMKQPLARWETAGSLGVGILVADTIMFQRADPNPSDANLGSFYGLAMPLLKRGLPVEPVQIESAAAPGFLNRYKLLLLTYEGQKPPKPEFHDALAAWVRAGGALVVVDDDQDPYNAVREWWNSAPYTYANPRRHLFERLGVAADFTGLARAGKGVLLREKASSAGLTYQEGGAEMVRKAARRAWAAVKLSWKESPALVLRRGPYLVAAGLEESVPGAKAHVLRGRFINLFDPELNLLDTLTLAPGTRALLFDLNSVTDPAPRVVAAACRVRDERVESGSLRFIAEGIGDTNAVVSVLTHRAPSAVAIGGKAASGNQYDYSGGVLRLRFANSVEGVPIEIRLP